MTILNQLDSSDITKKNLVDLPDSSPITLL